MTQRQHFLAGRAAYLAVVLIATLSDLHFSGDLAAASRRFARALTFSLEWRDAVDGLRNVALFAGLGGVWVATSLPGREQNEIVRATLLGLAVSITVEGLQCFSPVRTASLVDVTTNTVGTLGGALTVALLIDTLRRAKGARSYLGIPAFVLTGSYGLAALCEALTPLFHSEPLPNIDGGPLDRLGIVLHLALPLSWAHVPWLDVPLFAPAGFLAIMLRREFGLETGRVWPAVAFLGAMLVLAGHGWHGLAGLPVRWEACMTDACAIGLGAWAGHYWLASLTQSLRGAMRARAAIVSYAAVLCLWGLRPLSLETRGDMIRGQFSAARFIPLASLAER
ncbi:MAG TPA: VanZ family protein, partial [Gemmatimonadaceae bacterium]|nr:VanZ family protein [Gemmatimonadaceae bacterium]